MGQAGLEDGVMGVIRFDSGLIAQFHDAFTTRYAVTGFEIHGEEGSLIGTDCMTQAPKGEVLLRIKDGERQLSVVHENLYLRAVRLFGDAVADRGAPSATGEDGIKSLSVALSTREAARAGCETPIDLTT
jgi:1,5-anhydro-D-fructose reductase (1,5-anhydro-D-mannitol-forming)